MYRTINYYYLYNTTMAERGVEHQLRRFCWVWIWGAERTSIHTHTRESPNSKLRILFIFESASVSVVVGGLRNYAGFGHHFWIQCKINIQLQFPEKFIRVAIKSNKKYFTCSSVQVAYRILFFFFMFVCVCLRLRHIRMLHVTIAAYWIQP